MAKKPVKAKSKAVVGRAKKKWSFNLNKRSALFGIVGIMAFSIIGGTAYQKWQDQQLKARAAGWTVLLSNGAGPGTVTIHGCKTSMSGGFGPVWRVSFYVINWSPYTVNAYASIIRNGRQISGGTFTTTPTTTKVMQTGLYGSQLNPDTLSVVWGGKSTVRLVSSLTSC